MSVRTAYERPQLLTLGDVARLTLGNSDGNNYDGNWVVQQARGKTGFDNGGHDERPPTGSL